MSFIQQLDNGTSQKIKIFQHKSETQNDERKRRKKEMNQKRKIFKFRFKNFTLGINNKLSPTQGRTRLKIKCLTNSIISKLNRDIGVNE